MYERYTEQARRTVFFARYEASRFGSSYIEAEHLLLGILREGKLPAGSLPRTAVEEIRAHIEGLPAQRESISTSVDLPLSRECKQALAFAAAQAGELGHNYVDSDHLILGILKLESSQAAQLLRQHGIELASFREVVRKASPEAAAIPNTQRVQLIDRQSTWEETDEPKIAAPSLDRPVTALRHLVDRMAVKLESYSEAYGSHRLKRTAWSRKEAMGHLVDWATTHHGWFAQALAESRVTAAGYPQNDWVSAQGYQDFSWPEVVDAWIALNRLLLLVLARMPEEKMSTSCRIGIGETIPLSRLAAAYVEHCEDIAGQVLAKLA